MRISSSFVEDMPEDMPRMVVYFLYLLYTYVDGYYRTHGQRLWDKEAYCIEY